MPLLPPVSRPLRCHPRAIRAEAFEREDDLGNIGARLTDHKPRDVANWVPYPCHLEVPHLAYRARVGLKFLDHFCPRSMRRLPPQAWPRVAQRGEGGARENSDEAGTTGARAISDYEVQSNS